MQIPVLLVVANDGVPFPDCNGKLDIPTSRFHFMKTVEIEDPMLGKQINALVLAFVKKEEDIDIVLKNPVMALEYLSDIGVYCSVEEAVEAQDFAYISLQAISRVWLNDINIKTVDNEFYIYTELEPIDDSFEQEKPIIQDAIQKMISFCLENNEALSKQVISRIPGILFIETKFNILSDIMIKDPDIRLKWLLDPQALNRLEFLSTAIAANRSSTKPIISDKRINSFSANELKKRIQQLKLPAESMLNIQRELSKLETLQKSSNEYAATADYLNWVANLPWEDAPHKTLNLNNLMTALNESHYGLEDVKQDVLEHMALHEHVGKSRGTVLCFAGPAGVGKTSIAKQIALAMNRPLVRIALGGISDESEIRG